jgi:hypothetical protein
MGWKTFKERFGISHIVQVSERGICIGSGYVGDLVTVNVTTGAVSENSTFEGFLRREYPALLDAGKEAILQAIQAEDVFDAGIVVYTFGDGRVIEKVCEQPGWPNVTHDGQLMYENRFSTDKATVVGWALRDAQLGERFARDAVADAEKTLEERRAYLARCEAELAELRAAYPSSGLSA